MANIFKTTLKKDVIADIANGKREVRFPITKFWASRFTTEYNLDEKVFIFKSFDSLELSSPSNKDASGGTYEFDFDKIFVDGDEFVVTFKKNVEEIENCVNDINTKDVDIDNNIKESKIKPEKSDNENVIVDFDVYFADDVTENNVEDDIIELNEDNIENDEEIDAYFVDVYTNENKDDVETLHISNEDAFTILSQWFEDGKILDNFYEDDSVFETNAKQVIILPNGKLLGFKKTLPVNNDVEIRIEFDMNKKIYFSDFESFEDEIIKTLYEIRKNNFVFIWKRYTGIFMDSDGVYFGIKYSTRRSIGFNRKYNVQ